MARSRKTLTTNTTEATMPQATSPVSEAIVDKLNEVTDNDVEATDTDDDLTAKPADDLTDELDGDSDERLIKTRNKALLKLEQVDYNKATDPFFEKLNSVFSGLNCTEAHTRKLFNQYFDWLDESEERELEREEAKLLAQLKALRAKRR